MSDSYHIPVLLKESVEGLNIKEDGLYVDVTFGGGGHTSEILNLGGIVLGLDVDEDALRHAAEKFEPELEKERLILKSQQKAKPS